MPKRQKVGVDARNRTVRVEDTVIDKRGRVYTILWTEKALRKQRTVCAQTTLSKSGSYTFIKLQRVFRVGNPSTWPTRNKMRWGRLYDKYVRPIKKQEARKRRRAEESTKMWPCPVCKNGKQPTRFKIGIAVWRGKRLRVCSTPCKRKVLKEVRVLAEGYDHEETRRFVAWRYMKAGGQPWTSQTPS